MSLATRWRGCGARIAADARAGTLSAVPLGRRLALACAIAFMCAAVILAGCTSTTVAAGPESDGLPPSGAGNDASPDTAEPSELSAPSGGAETNAPLRESELVGRWQVLGSANKDVFVEFTEYGIWFGSDGCQQPEGSWWIDDAGELRFDSVGAFFSIACGEAPIMEALIINETAELNRRGRLMVRSIYGDQVQLERTSTVGTSLVGTWIGPASEASLTEASFSEDAGLTVRTPCGQMEGAWELKRTDLERYHDPKTEFTFVPSADILEVDAEALHFIDCYGDPAGPSIGKGSEYSFKFLDTNTFVVLDLAWRDSETPEQDLLASPSLTFHRIG